jgi:hypothetical protein
VFNVAKLKAFQHNNQKLSDENIPQNSDLIFNHNFNRPLKRGYAKLRDYLQKCCAAGSLYLK